jgi:transcriptional regulator with XRE-family HTH domain
MAADLTVTSHAEPPIGQRIREERVRKGMNLRALARAVNVSASHISQIETGKCRPSVSTLWSITTVLGVPLDELFEVSPQGPAASPPPDPAAEPPSTATPPGAAASLAALAAGPARRVGPVTHAGQREELELESGVVWEQLGRVPGLHVDFLRITYPAGSSSSGTEQLMRHSGIEYGYLISGQLIASLGFGEQVISPGDAICFESSTPHRYRNDGTEPAVGIWFVFEPEPDNWQ